MVAVEGEVTVVGTLAVPERVPASFDVLTSGGNGFWAGDGSVPSHFFGDSKSVNLRTVLLRVYGVKVSGIEAVDWGQGSHTSTSPMSVSHWKQWTEL